MLLVRNLVLIFMSMLIHNYYGFHEYKDFHISNFSWFLMIILVFKRLKVQKWVRDFKAKLIHIGLQETKGSKSGLGFHREIDSYFIRFNFYLSYTYSLRTSYKFLVYIRHRSALKLNIIHIVILDLK